MAISPRVKKESNVSRRAFLSGAAATAASAAAGAAATAGAASAGLLLNGCLAFVQESPVTILLPKNYEPPRGLSGWWYEWRLRDATMDFIKSQYAPNSIVPIWKERFSDINFTLDARIDELSAWACKAARRVKNIHSIDPALLMAGMYVESLFYEYAVSSVLAVGACQFIAPTARAKPYKLICAGELHKHHAPPFRLTEYAGAQQQYELAARELREIRNENKQTGKKQNTAKLEAAIEKARLEFKHYFLANVADKSLLDDDDRDFLNTFDQRTLPEHAVPAMARYIAGSLKARNGNVLAAWSAYNAGLGSTAASGYLKKYGKLPNGDTATYAEKIVLVAEDLNRRIFG